MSTGKDQVYLNADGTRLFPIRMNELNHFVAINFLENIKNLLPKKRQSPPLLNSNILPYSELVKLHVRKYN